ncbi:MAG: hypothetical protein OEV80_16830, partial [candidate division Zixibacteria bacterium]|nr:hypothetical protein [candidate division Zixibacteria bacterium]
ALTTLPGGYKLAAVLGLHNDDNRRYIDLYLSKVAGWSEGFKLVDSFCTHDKFDDWQNMNFIQESGGKLYLAATRNTRILPGTFGKDMAHLYEVKLRPGNLNRIRPDNCSFDTVNEVHTRQFINKLIRKTKKRYSHYQSNMAAGAGVYLHPSGSLFIYSCFHWRYRNRIAFAEYRPDPKTFTPDVIDSLDDAWVDMFYHDTYKGRRLGLVGRSDAKIADFSKLAVQGLSFGKNLSSVRYQIPKGWKLRLYRHKNFRTKNDHYDLIGNGRLKTERDLNKVKFGDKTYSCEYLEA